MLVVCFLPGDGWLPGFLCSGRLPQVAGFFAAQKRALPVEPPLAAELPGLLELVGLTGLVVFRLGGVCKRGRSVPGRVVPVYGICPLRCPPAPDVIAKRFRGGQATCEERAVVCRPCPPSRGDGGDVERRSGAAHPKR